MSDGGIVSFALVTIVWIGWPLIRIADHLGALRKLAERRQR